MVENLAKLVTKEDIFRGLDHGNILPSNLTPSTQYDVLIFDKLYPPKEVIRLAAKSKGLNQEEFSLNEGDSTNKFLQKMGFPIFNKKGKHLGGGDTGRVWKLGTRWGKGKPNYKSLLEIEKIVISVERFKYHTGDLVVIMDGHIVTAIARVDSEMLPVTNTPQLQKQFEKLEIEWEEWILTAKATIYNLSSSEQFIYRLDAGIREVQKQEIKEKTIKLWFEKNYYHNFLSSTKKKESVKPLEVHFSGKKSFKGINDINVSPKLDVDILSNNFARLLTNLEGNYGQMLGVFGQWGRGKTFFIDQVIDKLNINDKEKSEFYFVKFHAWKYQDTEGVWAYLYQQITEEYLTHKKDKYYLTSKLKEFKLLFRLNRIRNGFGDTIIFLMLLVLAITIVFIYPELKRDIEFWKTFFITSASIQTLLFLKKAWKLGDKGKRLIKKYTHKPNFNKLLGIQAEIQEELKYVLKTWIPDNTKNKSRKRILLFVDDLDRCKEERLIQVIDALRVMLEDDDIVKRVVIVTAIDEKILERAIALKYKEFLDKRNNDRKCSLIKEYLDKLFIACIKLPPLYDMEKDIIIDSYAEKIGVEVIDRKTNIQVTSHKIDSEGNRVLKTEIIEANNHFFEESMESQVSEQENISNMKKEGNKKEIYTIKSKELDLLKESAKKLKGNITPRQLRIFMYRYLLAKDLAKSFNNNEVPNQAWCKVVLDKIIENRNKDLEAENNNEKTNSEIFELKNISDSLKNSTQKIIDIVAPY
ncbi:P-loop NTPase fold protein [Tenacibaculum larymnensis]|uniref:KAP family NTPase n=1 Tax=Tenacibaculum larymnensis TaxID=2878201 RepID=A0A9X4EN69_9FLAO|nr:P-loop NTPase fold protein [Tenacibaculum larymnensis]MDE1207103.1 KAP family NTPase [Tenacibaculum larymnensis]